MNLTLELLIVDILKENTNMFMWPADFQEIDLEVILHRLNVDPNAKPVKQKKKKFWDWEEQGDRSWSQQTVRGWLNCWNSINGMVV